MYKVLEYKCSINGYRPETGARGILDGFILRIRGAVGDVTKYYDNEEATCYIDSVVSTR